MNLTRELLRDAALWATFVFGAVVLWANVCRLNASTPRTVRAAVRLQLALMAGAGAALMASPFGLAPRWALLFLLGAALAGHAMLGMQRWRAGVPRELASERMGLDDRRAAR